MVLGLPVIFMLLLVLPLVGLVLYLIRSNQTNLQGGFRLLQENFEALQRSGDTKATALRSEISQELQSNRKELQHGLSLTTQALEVKVSNIDNRLDARLKELSTGVQSKLEQNIREGFLHFEKVTEGLKQTEKQLIGLNLVGQSINDLNNLLKLPHLRGGFGEAMLERILADLLPIDSYELQYRIVPNSTERVDAIIRYPNAVLPIDSKFPREQVLPLFETNEPAKLELARKSLSEVMRHLARSIREKYIHPEHGTTEMALLFVPSETLYFEILRDPRLGEELAKNKVFAVSPNTLSVTLHAISIARNYYDMAKGVEKTIGEVRKARQHFQNFESRFDELGNSLTKAQNSFQTASTHLSRYDSAVSRLTGSENSPEIGLDSPASAGPALEPPII